MNKLLKISRITNAVQGGFRITLLDENGNKVEQILPVSKDKNFTDDSEIM